MNSKKYAEAKAYVDKAIGRNSEKYVVESSTLSGCLPRRSDKTKEYPASDKCMAKSFRDLDGDDYKSYTGSSSFSSDATNTAKAHLAWVIVRNKSQCEKSKL